MSQPQPLSPELALHTQRVVEARVAHDRRRASSDAFPLGLFGVLSLIAAAIAATEQWTALGIFWSIAGPAGGILIAGRYRHRDLRLRFDGPPAAVMIVTALGLVAGAIALGWSTGAELSFFAVGSGYVVFAAATGNRTTFRVAVAIIAAAWLSQLEAWTHLLGADAGLRTVVLTVAVGVCQLLGAAAEIHRTRRAPAA